MRPSVRMDINDVGTGLALSKESVRSGLSLPTALLSSGDSPKGESVGIAMTEQNLYQTFPDAGLEC